MKKVINCFKDDNPVIQKKLRRVTVEEGYKIATELLEILATRKDGIGLAANQIGIDAAVAVVNVREPIILINPEIVSKSTEIPFYEGCLSFPGKGCRTKRYETIEVTSENVEGILLKLLDRIQRDSEQQSDERNRRHEAMIEALGDVEKQLSRMDGIMSRMNGSGK